MDMTRFSAMMDVSCAISAGVWFFYIVLEQGLWVLVINVPAAPCLLVEQARN
jgi:hypothetical protein